MILRPVKDPSQEILKVYKKAWDTMIVVSKQDPTRLLNLRCSQLPFCPHEFLVSTSINPKYRHLDLRGRYYTSVGTTVHEVMQEALPQFTKRIYGNWVCTECGLIKKFTNQQRCCGFLMQYEEIDIDYKGIQGHVDCVWRVGKNEYYVVDFKTCSIQNSASKTKDPGAAYKEQLLAYAFLLRKQYDLNITGIMNLFLPRDNPEKAVAWSEPVGKKTNKETAARLKRYRSAHRTALNVNTTKDAVKMWNTFGACSLPYCKVCKAHNPKALLKDAVKRSRNLPLIDTIGK